MEKRSQKRKHVTLTIQEKLEIIHCVEVGDKSRQAIAMEFGIGKSTVHDIHKRRDQIRAFASIHTSDDMNKRRRVAQKMVPDAITFKDSNDVEDAKEEMLDSMEDFDYQEINEQDYEIVYEASLSEVNDGVIIKSKIEPNDYPTKLKRKSKTLTFREKYEVIQQIEMGVSVPMICQSYGIGRTTVYDYMRRKQEIIDFIKKSDDGDRKTFKRSKFPEVEDQVIGWCDATETFTKQQFYERAKAAFDVARENGSTSSPSGFCGSWSWAKRFFHRHPELKKKLITASGQPVDPAELSLSNIEYLDENVIDTKNNTFDTGLRSTEEQMPINKKLAKFLNFSEKIQVLDDIDAGKPVAIIAENNNVSKATIYEIFKRRCELREIKITEQNCLRKVWKMPRHPQLELELLQWCLKQKSFPLSNVLIADKALCLFDTLGLTGNFNPSSVWAKKFVLRHPELCKKQGLYTEVETFDPEITNEELTFDDEHEMGNEYIETCDAMTGSYEFNDADITTPEYEEAEYIVEELDSQNNISAVHHDEQLEIEPVKVKIEPEWNPQQNKIVKVTKKVANEENLVSDRIALKSLNILIKYTEEQGHDDMLSQLIEYQTQLTKEIS